MNQRDNDHTSDRPGWSSPPTMTPALATTPSVSPYQPATSPHRGAAPPLYLTARFLSLPDVQIDIPDPGCVTAVGLKTLIRQQLVRKAAQAAVEASSSTPLSSQKQKEQPSSSSSSSSSSSPTLQDAHRRRLRIIYAGKILADNVVLAHVLRPVPPPPRAVRPATAASSAKSIPVGEEPKTDFSNAKPGIGAQPQLDSAATAGRVYVNCSIGDIMPARELSVEADAAAAATAAVLYSRRSGALENLGLSSTASASGASTPICTGGRNGSGPMRVDTSHRRGTSGGQTSDSAHWFASSEQQRHEQGVSSATASLRNSTTTAAPRGFERLLQAGFTLAEVNQLRLQFNTIQATRFTPDTMPSPDSLRALEDSWLDNSQGDGPGGGGIAGFGGQNGASGGLTGDDGSPLAEDTGLPGLLDTLVRAMVIGFVFPLGSMGWLMREEGLWTPRWRMFVSLGIVVSLMIGSVKTLAGEW
ncbi:hypothetical protein SEPCBS57363_000083 [Sporothrix epigloea]|uniref:Ubiquitin-like domain-containing protein n=1 Tax=Sporothrix epigloea TaxID=1892477 RepID=A0ABP0D2P7_9PEZI